MKLFVQTVLDGIFSINVQPDNTIQQVKQVIANEKQQYTPELQHLYVSGLRIDKDKNRKIVHVQGLKENGFVICLLKVCTKNIF